MMLGRSGERMCERRHFGVRFRGAGTGGSQGLPAVVDGSAEEAFQTRKDAKGCAFAPGHPRHAPATSKGAKDPPWLCSRFSSSSC